MKRYDGKVRSGCLCGKQGQLSNYRGQRQVFFFFFLILS